MAQRRIRKSSTALIGKDKYDVTTLAASLGFLTRIVNLQIRELIRSSRPLLTSPTVYSALTLIEANPGIKQVRIAILLGIQESNLATLIREMTAENLIEESAGGRSRRSVGVTLSEKGLQFLAKVKGGYTSIDSEYANTLSRTEYKQLTALLARLYETHLPSNPSGEAESGGRGGRHRPPKSRPEIY